MRKIFLIILCSLVLLGCRSKKSTTGTEITIRVDTIYTPKLIPIIVPPDTFLLKGDSIPCPNLINMQGQATSKNGKQTIKYIIKDNKLEIQAISNQYVLWQQIFEKTIQKEITKVIRERIEIEQKHKTFIDKLHNLLLWIFGIALVVLLIWLYGKKK